MNRPLPRGAAALSGALALIAAVAPPTAADEEREPIAEALRVIAAADPALAAELRGELEEGDLDEDEVLEHAAYLVQLLLPLEDDESDPPRSFARILASVGPLMDEWFDVRHRLRELDVAELERERDELAAELTEQRATADERVEELVEEVLEDPESVEEALEDARLGRLETIAYEALDRLAERDEPLVDALERLERVDHDEFLDAIADALEDDPSLMREVEEHADDATRRRLRRHGEMQRALEAALAARSGAQTGADGRLPDHCADVVRLDLELAELSLGELRRELAEARERLEFRLRHRDAILAFHVAELAERDDLFEW